MLQLFHDTTQLCCAMLNLTNLRVLLAQALSPSAIHSAVLFTPEGQLVSFVSDPPRSKDEIRVIVGLGGEIWQETKEHGLGMVDSEVSLHTQRQARRCLTRATLLLLDWPIARAPHWTATPRVRISRRRR